MASTTTGEMFTQEQFDAMSVSKRASLGLVPITRKDQDTLAPLSPEDRKQWLKVHKRKTVTRRALNKRERQNKKQARNRKS